MNPKIRNIKKFLLKLYHFGAFCAVVFVAYVFWQIYSRPTMSQAAAQAARCVGWPEDIAKRVQMEFGPGIPLPGMGMGTLVSITGAGKCGSMQPAAIFEAPSKKRRPIASIPDADTTYVLTYFGPEISSGGYIFIATRSRVPQSFLGEEKAPIS
jgi:hypothetical protein